MNRLSSGLLSVETLFTALQTVHTSGHPSLRTLGVIDREREALIAKLSGIVTSPRGFNSTMKMLAIHSNDNPDQLIANVLQYVRNTRSC